MSPSCGAPACSCSGELPASVNGVPLHAPGQRPEPGILRQRACTELLRQAAQRQGLLSVGDLPGLDGIPSAAASAAIEALLERELHLPEPDEASCRRYFEAHASRFAVGERLHASHVLFAVTPGVDVEALRRRAEALLVELRCAGEAAFAEAAREQSNCPSGQDGGRLGWLGRGDCAPEFAAALFGQDESGSHCGVLPRLVRTRFGLHVVCVHDRDPGRPQPFEAVQAAIAQTLKQQAYVTALRRYLDDLAAKAHIEDFDLTAADSPIAPPCPTNC